MSYTRKVYKGLGQWLEVIITGLKLTNEKGFSWVNEAEFGKRLGKERSFKGKALKGMTELLDKERRGLRNQSPAPRRLDVHSSLAIWLNK